MPRPSRRGGSVVRVFACLLLGAILADIALDGDCDPVPLSPAAGAGLRAAGGAADPCADTCVGDCYCCTRGETAGPVLTLPGLTVLARTRPARPACVPAVVLPVSEPPPLAIS